MVTLANRVSCSGMVSQNNLVPLSAAASELGIQARELRREVERGWLPHVRVGERAILLDLELVRRLLAERASLLPDQEEVGQ